MEGYYYTMTKPFSCTLTILILLLTIISTKPISASESPPPPAAAAYTNFIRTSCNTTTYPILCYKSLIPYVYTVRSDPLRLCKTALSVTISAASNASSTVKKLYKQKGLSRIEAAVIRDCIDDLKDCVYELKQTMTAVSHVGDEDWNFQWANAKTWASAAITDADTCMDGFSGRKVNPNVRNKIRSSILGVGKLTSNALSLINHLNY